MKDSKNATVTYSRLKFRVRRGPCSLQRQGWPCGLCEADRRQRHLDACDDAGCWLCALICPEDHRDTYGEFCVVEWYVPRRLGAAA